MVGDGLGEARKKPCLGSSAWERAHGPTAVSCLVLKSWKECHTGLQEANGFYPDYLKPIRFLIEWVLKGHPQRSQSPSISMCWVRPLSALSTWLDSQPTLIGKFKSRVSTA